MLKPIFVLLFCCSGHFVHSQFILERATISSFSTYYSSAQLYVSGTGGQVNSGTAKNGDILISQGFQQPTLFTTSIPNISSNPNIHLFPNPVYADCTVRSNQEEQLTLHIYSITGQLMRIHQGIRNVVLNFDDLPLGMYSVECRDARGHLNKWQVLHVQ